jgi:hypothetical protein
MKPKLLLAFAALLALAANPADAALQKYRLRTGGFVQAPDLAPNPDGIPTPAIPGAVALIGASGANPVLVKLLDIGDDTVTVIIPGLAVGLFRSAKGRQGPGGPGALHGNPNAFTGTGSPASGSTIRWGVVTGWTNSGSAWCNSEPAIICSLAMFVDEATTDTRTNSASYDLGTWSFHGTGFTSVPFVNSYNTNNPGNVVKFYQGAALRDGTVPAISIVGSALLGASLVLGGIAASRRR